MASAEDCCAAEPTTSGSVPAVQTEATAAKQPRRSQAKAGGTRARRHGAASGAGQAGGQSVQLASAQSEAAARRGKKEKTEGKKETKGKKGKSGGKTGKSQETSEPPAGGGSKSDSTSTQAGAVASAAAVESATPAPTSSSSAAAPSTATTSPQLGLSNQPTVSAQSHHKRSRARHARALAAGGSAVPALAGASSAPLASASTPSHPAPAKPAAKARRAQAGLAPLVTTVTKIVGVVPLAVRVLIGALVALALALAMRSRLSARRARRLERQRVQLLDDVGLLQAALLPAPPARLGPVGTSVAYRPADGPGAGGDFYDVFALEGGQVAVIVGDVSGHGRGALPHTALLRFTIRAYLEAGLSPRRALQTAGSVLERQLGGSFATVVAATYHPRERTLTYSCAGHPPPLVLGPSGQGGDAARLTPVTVCSSPPIGAGMRTGMRQTVVSVPGAAQVCFHTDGVTEARVAGDLYGDERLTRGLRNLGPEATAKAVLDGVAEEADARPDDMAACLLRIEGGEDAPRILREELELDDEVAAGERTERFLDACGVEPWEVAEIMREARSGAAHRNPLMLELRFSGDSPAVELRPDNVLHPAALVAAGGSQVLG